MVKAYLADYPLNHRAKSVIFAKQRLAHVTRLLGAALLSDLTEDRVKDYIKTRIAERASGRTINMEVGERSRAVGNKWSVMWPKVRKLEENHHVGQALSPEDEIKLLNAAADPPRRTATRRSIPISASRFRPECVAGKSLRCDGGKLT